MQQSGRRPLAVLGFALLLSGFATAPHAVHASAPPGTTCPVFPADNVWNTDISTLPVNSHSAAWLASTGATSGRLLHPDFGAAPYGIPFNVVSTAHATANFNFLYWQESDPTVATQQPQGPYPYGADLQVEAPTDSHLLSINKDTCHLYEIAGTDYNGAHTGWSGAVWDLNSNALRPDTWTSADAAGLPIFPGLVRLDEVQAGAINHAIRFTVQQSDTSHLWPARHDAGTASNPNLPPMGARFRLKSTFDISGFNASAQVVLTAMMHYGLIVADNGSNWYFQGTTDAGWNNEPYATMVSQLKTVPASAFEAIDESSMMVSPDSGQAVNHGFCGSAGMSPGTTTAAAGSTVAFTASSTGCTGPQYEFWVRYPDGTWNLKQPFGASAAFSWDSTGLAPGSYLVHAWVNTSGTGHEAIAESTVTLTGCASASVSPPTVTAPDGSTVNLTASSSGCTPVYAFWVQYPDTSWHLKQPFGGASFAWDTTGLAPGNYLVHAWANEQHAAPTLEVYGTSRVTLTACTSAALNPPSPSAPAGSTLAFTTTSSGCSNPQYEFWVQYPDTTWHLKQPFSGSSAFSWSTTGLGPGAYTVHEWVSATGAGHDSIGSSSVTLTGCSAAAVTPRSGSTAVGNSVMFTVAPVTCTATPVYEFWLQYPDGSWHQQTNFTTTNTWTWNSTGRAKGSYVIHVWTNNQGADTGTYETIGSATYTLS